MTSRRTTRTRRWGAFALLIAVVGVLFGLNLAMGAVTIPFGEVVGALSKPLGLSLGSTPSGTAEAVLWDIRMPRSVMALIVGAAFSASGAGLQGLFRNRLADPYLLGLAPGAAIGGVLGATAGSASGAIAGGAVAGMVTGLLLKRLSVTRASEPSRFILTGLALGLALTAWVGFIVFTADRTKVPPLEFWLLGNLSGTTWHTVGTTLVIVALGIAALLAGGRALDLLALGEADARRLGLDVGLTLTVMLLAVGATSGGAIGAGGIIVFVGLLGPHLARRLVGPEHRPLLIASALSGGGIVLAADLIGRTLASPTEIPVGLVTAAIGGPFFLWLIRVPDYDRP